MGESIDKISPFSKVIAANQVRLGISDEELDSLTNAIKTRYGIDFTNYEKASLKRGFTRLIQKNNLENVVDLWTKIMKEKDFLIRGIDDLTVNLTELFRNPEFWIKLKNDVLPQFSEKNKIDFWHAGCSSGEEVYTMAMVLKELNLLHKATTLATDLSNTILDVAKEGKYSNLLINRYQKGFKAYFPFGNIGDWFDIGETDSVIKDKYKRHIEFKKHDLVGNAMNREFDLIFCRNVMIYFDDVLKMKVLKLFHSSLKEGGFFAIGYYDMLPNDHKIYFELYDSSTRLYKKKK
ncbi:MAG TPA: protein-glutamate O-methyltransferase CheR [Cytophagaceae bacterium]|jgi:chemotaxis protein methyltransferase CheR|nr:protein-glutamate O-methyltransferase CheR [Cytophagaceae bacterium]